MKVCVKSPQGQSENVVASFELCPVVVDRPHALVVPVAAVHAVVALPADDMRDGYGAGVGVGSAAGYVALKGHRNKHSLSPRHFLSSFCGRVHIEKEKIWKTVHHWRQGGSFHLHW